MKCFYHSADLDGHCSGAIVKYKYPDCEMIGINYGDEFPWEEIKPNEIVYMVDFSLQPFSDMVRLADMCQLFWVDHHISAIKKDDEGDHLAILGYRQDGTGACSLVWQYLFNTKVPLFVSLLAEYDVWNHSDPRTLPFQYGMRQNSNTLPENQLLWQSLMDIGAVNEIGQNGSMILSYQKIQNEKYAKACSFEIEFNGLKCVIINKMLTSSQLFDSVFDPEKHDAMVAFGYRNGFWKFSIYSTKEDIDVSVVAQKYGGGGHRGAAGFQCETLPFDLK